MKKIYLLIISILMFIPFNIVNADGISCYDEKKLFDLSSCTDSCNFSCSGITGDNVTFTYKGSESEVDYTDHFKLDSDKSTIEIVNKDFKFDDNFDSLWIVISDGVNSSGTIKLKNNNYKPTTSTTTTKDPNIKVITVTLDPNNGDDKVTKTCNIAVGSETCAITLPKLDTTGFNGWGTADKCKSGNSGSIKVDKDTTYYACYENNDDSSNEEIYLESLEITDKDTDKKIEFGTYSRKKKEYEFKVLNEVKNLDIKTKVSDGIEVSIENNEDLEEGENEILIKLTKGTKSVEYKLLVTRLKEGETINSIHYLKSLVVGGYEKQLQFNKNVFTYTLTIANDVDKLLINAVTENDEDTYEIKDNKDLINGSKIKIVVSGEDEKETTYTINIIKEKSNLPLFIIIGLVGFLVILLIVLVVVKANKNKKNQNLNNQNNNGNIEVLNL